MHHGSMKIPHDK